MEFIAPAQMSHPGTPDTKVHNSLSNLNSIFSLFPPAKSLSGSDSSLSNQSPIPNFSPSISSLFPPDYSRSSSLPSAAETQHWSPYYIPSCFPPTHSERNSISSETSLYGFANSIPSLIFQPNHSHSSSIDESTHQQNQFTDNHFQGPDEIRWLSIESKFMYHNKRIEVPQVVEAEFVQACHEGWTYAIYWELDWPYSPSLSHGTFSVTKGFYNAEDQHFENNIVSFLLRKSWPGSVIHQVFGTLECDSVCYKGALNSYRARQGQRAGLKTMSWIRVLHGVMEFGSTKLIDSFDTNKQFVRFGRDGSRTWMPPKGPKPSDCERDTSLSSKFLQDRSGSVRFKV